MKLMTENQKRFTQTHLRNCAHWNNGQGLLVTRNQAEWLRENGIDGPYTEIKPIPTENTNK